MSSRKKLRLDYDVGLSRSPLKVHLKAPITVPLIRARRDESDYGATPAVPSSTAQRIIETLQNLSTPVLNAGKIPLQSISTPGIPLHLSVSEKFASVLPGSPLLRTSPGNFNKRPSAPPVMIDAATNTEIISTKTSSTSTDKIGTSASANNPDEEIISPNNNTNGDGPDGVDGDEFTFGPAWPSDVFEEYIFKEPPAQTVKIPLPPSTSTLPPSTLPPSTSTLPPSTLPPLTLPPLSSNITGTHSKWRCPTCMVENELQASTCVCCSEKNPNTKIVSTPITKKWRCPTCMVDNAVDASQCVCCSEKNPSSTPLVTPTPKKWRCPTCMVENQPVAMTCVCCSEKNPNSNNDSAPVAASPANGPTPTFKFGVTGATSSDLKSNTNTTFTFGNESSTNAQKTSIPTFTFGAPTAPVVSTTPSTLPSVAQPSATTTSSFQFGISNTNTVTSPASKPTFGFSAPGPVSTSVPVSSTDVQPVSTLNTVTPASGGLGLPKPINANSNVPFSAAFTFGKESSSDAQNASIPTFKLGTPTTAVASTTPIPSTLPSVAQPSTTTNSLFQFGINNTNTATSPASKPSISFSAPAPVSTSVPVASINVQPVSTFNTVTPASGSFGMATPIIASSNVPTTSPVSLFGTGSQQSTQFGNNTSLTFGAPSTANNDPPKPAFTFGAQANAKFPFASFSFSSATPSSVPVLPTTPAVAAPAPTLGSTPNFSFGSNSSSIGSFGLQTAPPAPALQQPQGGFTFGGSAPVNPSASPAPPSFSMTPNMNFGAVTPTGANIPFGNPTQPNPTPGSQPPPSLFTFTGSATNQSESPGPGGRKIKKAVRRFNK